MHIAIKRTFTIKSILHIKQGYCCQSGLTLINVGCDFPFPSRPLHRSSSLLDKRFFGITWAGCCLVYTLQQICYKNWGREQRRKISQVRRTFLPLMWTFQERSLLMRIDDVTSRNPLQVTTSSLYCMPLELANISQCSGRKMFARLFLILSTEEHTGWFTWVSFSFIACCQRISAFLGQ